MKAYLHPDSEKPESTSIDTKSNIGEFSKEAVKHQLKLLRSLHGCTFTTISDLNNIISNHNHYRNLINLRCYLAFPIFIVIKFNWVYDSHRLALIAKFGLFSIRYRIQ